ncbi:glycerate kinase [Shewanella sp. Isolate11]|uniref:glycerate kinase n=1 Tax=Shewanella sp. Isolate11 TaxID=2908530 RepID=UPI001EFE5C08|nr:glycerate kinase [Shewanella sp. Isolate11]MCG9696202.1 glycerate kinase [Shewanella sp. Isolate11]
MKIVIAPDSYKESLSAMEVATVIEQGFRQVLPKANYVKVPVADGGEGTVQSMIDATGGHLVNLAVTGPLGTKVKAHYGILGLTHSQQSNEKTAIIEMASASGLHHVASGARNPLMTTSFGTGELIADALDADINHIIIGLGGSATNDGGVGMLQALGAQFLDIKGNEIAVGGAALANIDSINISKLHPKLASCHIEVACDVNNPLCGEQGASAIFGPQKGASDAMVTQLDQALNHFADKTVAAGIRECRNIAGAGAAGGMGYAVLAYLNAQLRPGIDIVMETVDLASHLVDADLVITGEGRLDSQTLMGKTPMGVANAAKQFGVPVIAIAGCVSEDANILLQHGFNAIFSVTPRAMELQQVLSSAQHNLLSTAVNIAALYNTNR